jgi:hypothetical protein
METEDLSADISLEGLSAAETAMALDELRDQLRRSAPTAKLEKKKPDQSTMSTAQLIGIIFTSAAATHIAVGISKYLAARETAVRIKTKKGEITVTGKALAPGELEKVVDHLVGEPAHPPWRTRASSCWERASSLAVRSSPRTRHSGARREAC